ncbi:MAG TPA: hypothetical protein VGG72_27505 [Bryobacteraceae bacterium]|jgi:hypothetical protein
MTALSRFLAGVHRHKVWAWIGLLAYACAVTFPHQPVQDVVGELVTKISRNRVYQLSVTLAFIEAAVFIGLFVRALSQRTERGWLAAYWILCFLLMIGTWRVFMANNTELVHFPQYFPEGMVLLALTLSPVESLAWIALFGGLDETYQYIYLLNGRPAPLDLNDIYMDVIGGAAGIVFAMVCMGYESRTASGERWIETGKRILSRPGVLVIFGILLAGAILLWSGVMVRYEPFGVPHPHWFALSHQQIESFWYVNDKVLGPHHFHELEAMEGVLLILVTMAFFVPLERKLRVLPKAAFARRLK